jgi:hypothetical protein
MTALTAGATERSRVVVSVVSVMLILACGFWGTWDSWHSLSQLRGRSIVMDPIDTAAIADGLWKAHTLKDCWSWFHGAWVAKNQFYRPLSSMVWWVMYKAWGINALAQFQLVSELCHLAFLLVLWGFLRTLYGNALAVAATCVFASFLTMKLGLPSGTMATVKWLDVVEMWVGSAILVSGWLFVIYLRTNSRRCLGASLLAFVIGIGFKEMAYVVPLFLVFLMWHEGSFAKWKAIAAYFAIGAVCFAYRTYLFHGRGAHYGSNGSWKVRAATDLGGGMAAIQLNHMAFDSFAILFLLLAIANVAVFVTARSRHAFGWLSLWGVAFFATLCWIARLDHVSVDVVPAMWALQQNDGLPSRFVCDSFPVVILSLFWFRFATRPDRVQLEGWVWAIIMYLPLTTAPITDHALYQCAVGWAVFFAAPVLAYLRQRAPKLVNWLDGKFDDALVLLAARAA